MVSGTVHPERVLQNSTGKAGDLLVLTKPIGVGALAQGLKKGLIERDLAEDLVSTMVHLNRGASEAAQAVGVHAATDVTGFSLLGHALEMTDGAGLGAGLWMDQMPVLYGARDLISQGIHPGATGRNLQHFGPRIRWAEKFERVCPQTVGGSTNFRGNAARGFTRQSVCAV